jgi:hypothetical protein
MATQDLLVKRGTPIVFKDSGGDAAITLQNLAYGAGRKSAMYDRGAGSKPERYLVTTCFQHETAPQVGETVDTYLCQSDGTLIDGNLTANDEALVSAALPNLKSIGPTTVQVTTLKTNFIKRFVVEIHERYFAVGVWNGSSGDNLTNTANVCSVTFTPLTDELQAPV